MLLCRHAVSLHHDLVNNSIADELHWIEVQFADVVPYCASVREEAAYHLVYFMI